jgi:hypothetical protein
MSIPSQVYADTLDVAVQPVGNINTVINSDTVAGGFRAHPDRVYRLARGVIYQMTEPIKINGNLNIIAAEGTTRPPVLAPAILTDGSSIDHFFDFIGANSNIDISNLYLLSVRSDQSWLGWSAAMRVNADHIAIKLRGVIFDAFSEAGIRVSAHWTKLDVQDCTFRNLQQSGSWFGGQPFMTDQVNHMDTVKFINNTFFACGSYLWSIRGYDKYSLFEHNTVVYGIVNPFLTPRTMNQHVKNNIFYSLNSMGGTPQHILEAWLSNYPDTTSSGILMLREKDTVSSWYYGYNPNPDSLNAFTGSDAYVDTPRGVTSDMLITQLRTIDVANNSYFWPKALTDYYKAYNDTVASYDSVASNTGTYYLKRTLTLPKFMTDYTRMVIDSLLTPHGATVNVVNNNESDPGFNSDITNFASKVVEYVNKIVTNKLDSAWHYKPNGALYPPVWPLPENLAYTNTTMQSAGMDGFALGDLNWFPTQKEAWKLTGVVKDPGSLVPDAYSLSEAYPNPFNPETNIKFNIAKAGNVKLVVYNILGQKVRTLLDNELTAGQFTAKWDGRDDYGFNVSSGVYFFQLESGSFNMTKKMVLMK